MKVEPSAGRAPEFRYIPGLNQHPVDFRAVLQPRF